MHTLSASHLPETLTDLLRRRAAEYPTEIAYTFLNDGERDAISITYHALDEQARTIAGQLLELNATGERALLLYPPGIPYIAAFFGCLYAGVTAVPAYPPRLNRPTTRLESIVANSGAMVVLSTVQTLADMQRRLENFPYLAPLRWVGTDDLNPRFAEAWRDPAMRGDALAFLQYTSGSTSTPKGVMLTHSNLLSNLGHIQRSFDLNTESKGVIWLPPYHDMGLIGGILEPMYAKFPVVLMPPVAFLQRPIRWLEAISRYGGTVSGGPNFAYEACLQHTTPEQRANLDLSTWQVAFSGAEPVRPETLKRFTEAFAPSGFRYKAFYPCYGLAEATLIVSGDDAATEPHILTIDEKGLTENQARLTTADDPSARSLTSCGQTMEGQRLLVVDLESNLPCADGEVGEIWVAGASIAQGYWERPQESDHAFHARLANEPESPRFLRTGDLGFMQGGDLYVTGRLKDLIIIRGRNYYPQDIELTVEASHPALLAGAGAAFAVTIEGVERLVVTQEISHRHRDPNIEAIADTIRQAVSMEHELNLYGVVLLRTGSIPKTSSGKIMRHACRNGFLEGTLNVVGQSILGESFTTGATLATDPPPAPVVEESFILKTLRTVEDNTMRTTLLMFYLQEQIAKILRIPQNRLSPSQTLGGLGLDSLMLFELKNEVERTLGIEIPLDLLLDSPALQELSAALVPLLNQPSTTVTAQPPAPTTGRFALSYGQRSLWFLQELAPESTAYTIANAVKIESALNLKTLRDAFERLVARHPALRTSFTVVDNDVSQDIRAHGSLAFQEEDGSAWSDADLQAKLDAAAHQPFDLAQGELLRLYLVRRAPESWVLLLTVHHSVMDLWSLMILLDELRELYTALHHGRAAEMPALTHSYVDYQRWQAELLAGAEGEKLWRYWSHRLAGELPVLNLPTDRPRPPFQTFEGATQTFTIPAAVTQGLQQLTRDNNTTLYTVVLAAFQLFLARYSGQEDILVGSPTAGRSRAQWANLVGYFVNPIVLRATVRGNPAFNTFLHQVRQTVLEALAHQDYPFPLLVERLQPQRDPSYSPLFQAMFVFQKPHRLTDEGLPGFILNQEARMQLGDLTLHPHPLPRHVAQFDLSLLAVETGDTIQAAFEYNTALFNAETMARMVANFQQLLVSITTAPAQPIRDLTFLSEGEAAQVMVAWNNTTLPYDETQTLHTLVEAQVARTPNAAAVVAGQTTLTYAELNERANRLAHYLRQQRVGAETCVGISMHRSEALIVAMLAVLKAGGTYVPLDPTYPAERLAFLLEDTQAPIVLTECNLQSRLPASAAQTLLLDEETSPWDDAPATNLPATVTAAHVAYIIYTSGSTGHPKGVAITHRNAAALIAWAHTVYQPEQLAGVLASTSINFDLSVFEIFVPLSLGGTVLVVENALALAEGDTALPITLINTVPSAIIELLRLHRIPDTVNRINLAGEPLRTDVVNALYEQTHVRDVYDLYGPSEDTTYSTYTRRDAYAPATIGRPIANSYIYLLDAYMRPVPIGVAGEIYIGGAGVARGYLRRPDLTADRFVPDPFATESGGRLYKTGDLARYFANGTLEYLGRLDYQVKVRGFRIELSEIESILRQYPAIQGAVVMARREHGEPQLVAYLVPQEGQTLDLAEVKQRLKQTLPDYMIPAVMMVLPDFPLTANGKIDRKALPLPDSPVVEAESDLPRTATESHLAALWAEVLGHGTVGIHHNFFELGGHSLLAMRLIARVRDEVGVELPVRAFFAAPTVAELAAYLEQQQGETAAAETSTLTRRVHGDIITPSFAQQRLWVLEQLEPGSATYNMPTAVRLRGILDSTALEQSLTDIVARHDGLRAVFAMHDNQLVQRITPPAPFHLEIVEQRHVPPEQRDAQSQALIRGEARRPFDLSLDPLIRGKLVRFADDDHLLLLTLHHIVADGWSLAVLIEDLMRFYPARRDQGNAHVDSLVAPLPIQYADYAVWQREQADSEATRAAEAYWTAQLEDLPTLQLLTDYVRPSLITNQGAHVPIQLSPALSRALQETSQQAGVTLFMTLLTAFQVLLHRYTNQSDIVVGSPISGRTHHEVESLIGMFVNTLVLRTDLSGNPTFQGAAERVREVVLNAFAHQNTPFEQLVERLQPERDLSRHPLFQVMFAMNEAVEEALSLPDLQLEVLDADQETAKFDLTLTLTDTKQGIRGSLEYNVALFAAESVRGMAEQFITLLEAIVADPVAPIATYALQSEATERMMLHDWNDTRQPYPDSTTLPDVWESRVAKTPDAPALISEDGTTLSYAALNRHANQLAHWLQQQGVRADSPVAVSLERSPHSIIALFAIFKAGGVYVPIDPDSPAERWQWLMEDSQSRVLLTHRRYADHTATYDGTWLCLDDAGEALRQQPDENPTRHLLPDHLAYIIYTSGSTGQPKGVGISHRASLCHTTAISAYYQIQPNDRLLAFAAFTFDASFDHILPALLNGAAVVLRGAELWSTAVLEQTLNRLTVTVADFSTSYYHLLAQEWSASPDHPTSPLRLSVVGGETLLPSTVSLWQRSRLRHSTLLNTYGPTEATVAATVYKVPPLPVENTPQSTARIPIGRPLANRTAYILDKQGQPVPPGIPGELHLGGVPLARGYHRQPALTAERFIPNPFAADGSRLYRTGDMARFRADGLIEFLGRGDDQVKIRGFRVELGEVESVFLQHPSVREAVVVVYASPTNPQQQQLVAYIVPVPESAIDLSDLRTFVNTRLPQYMIPATMMTLETLPVRPSGKLDRKALPTPTLNEYEAMVAPRSETEATLAQLWQEVLGIEQVSVESSFFDLGGHSLLATQVLSRVRETFNVDVPLRAFFEAPTIAGLAVSIAQQQVGDMDEEMLRLLLASLDDEGSSA